MGENVLVAPRCGIGEEFCEFHGLRESAMHVCHCSTKALRSLAQQNGKEMLLGVIGGKRIRGRPT